MSRLTDRLERDLREIATGAQTSPSAWESIVARLDEDAGSEVPLAPASAPDRSKRPVWLVAAAAALVVVTGSIAVLTSVGDDQSISTAVPDLTATFVSPRNGFSIKHPEGATVTPAKQLWGFGEQVDEGFDVVETDSITLFKGASTGSGFRDDGSMDERVDQYVPTGDHGLSDHLPDGCGVPRRRQEEITIDGQSGRVAECQGLIEATVVAGGRLYLFILTHDRDDARAVFDAFVATIDLTPETAVDFPGLTTTFVSPTYGYSFGYLDRGGLTMATELWDPDDEPFDDIDFDLRFDAVETGLGAYFEAASTGIPDGVSIDEWVDEYVTPVAAGGCGFSRSQQAEITIDGQAGRITECRNKIQATVVAGGRLYLFMLSHSGGDVRAYFDAWLATIDLTPETAAGP